MKNIKKLLCLIMITVMVFANTGCVKSDTMEDITIYTTVYPIEYITDYLYGENSTINSIYPDGIIPSEYTLTSKQIKDYSSADLFIFNGLDSEKDYVTDFFKYNKNFKIIDATSSMEVENRVEELWLNPSNLLMIAQNIKTGFNEYISNHYLIEGIDEKYDELKIELSNLDASIRLVASNATTKNLIVTDDLFLFLEKYGFNIISLDSDTTTEKTIADAKKLLNNGSSTTIFAPKGEDLNDAVESIIDETDAKIVYLNTLSNLSSSDRNSKKDYQTIMKENIESIKDEVYK